VFVALVVVCVVVSALGVGKRVVCERAMRVACRGVRTFGLQRCCEGESEGADARHSFFSQALFKLHPSYKLRYVRETHSFSSSRAPSAPPRLARALDSSEHA
jgi:hypothetical protein